MEGQRAQWSSRVGFILAAAGSAIGLGNIWKFPYITGMNGGGWFVLIYLLAILIIGLPIMMAEIFIGRSTQCSPVGGVRKLSRPGSPWIGIGGLGVFAAFVILSYYAVVAGWALHYTWLSFTHDFTVMDPDAIGALFGGVFEDVSLNLFWFFVFMGLTAAIVLGGIQRGVERWARILMPMLLFMMLVLLWRASQTDGFRPAIDFVFGAHSDKLTSAGVLEAVGHAFFTLSLGMGAMITYGSYLKKSDDLVTTSLAVSVLDTVIALMACMVLFPIIFSYGMEASAGPGLVFVSLPIAFSQMPGGAIWSTIFFVLLSFAALTSTISLLEVAVAYFIDELKWTRKKATLFTAAVISLVGIPSAMSGGSKMFGEYSVKVTTPIYRLLGHETGKNWFDTFDYLASNWMLPIGGLAIALFVAWRVGGKAREQGFLSGTKYGQLYWGWIFLLRFIVPIGVGAVFLHAIGVL